jgi:hypothetical protein
LLLVLFEAISVVEGKSNSELKEGDKEEEVEGKLGGEEDGKGTDGKDTDGKDTDGKDTDKDEEEEGKDDSAAALFSFTLLLLEREEEGDKLYER